MKEITLALGGGGVKGYAHVGVLRVLEQAGFSIRAIAGTSAGGLIGSGYVSGFTPDELEQCLLEMDQTRLYGRLAGDEPSMMGLSGVVQLLVNLLGERTFAESIIPFGVTAVDLDTASLYALQRGRLIDAVLATIAVPGVFPPRRWEDKYLVDGGVLDPVPINLARYLQPDLPVVAVVLSPPPGEWAPTRPPRLLASLPFLSTYLSRLRMAQALNIFLRSVDIAGAQMTELRLQIDQPDIIIRPAVPDVGFMDNVDIRAVIREGEIATENALPALEELYGWRGWLSRQTKNYTRRGKPLTWGTVFR